jgi:hypothetical protein
MSHLSDKTSQITADTDTESLNTPRIYHQSDETAKFRGQQATSQPAGLRTGVHSVAVGRWEQVCVHETQMSLSAVVILHKNCHVVLLLSLHESKQLNAYNCKSPDLVK